MKVPAIILLVAYAAVPALAQEAPAADATNAQTITIRGTTYAVVPDETLRSMGFEVPIVSPEKNAGFDYLEAIEAYRPLKWGSELAALRDAVMRDGWTDEAWPLAKHLEDNEETLALLKRAATKPACHFPLLLEKGKSLDEDTSLGQLLLPYLAQMREFARFIVVVGKALEFEGRHAEALDTYMLAPRLGGHVAQDPLLINGLVGIACSAIGRGKIEQCLVRNWLDEETLVQAQKRARELSRQGPSFVLAMRHERVFSTRMTERIIKNPSLMWESVGRKPTLKDLFWAYMILTEQGSEQARREIREFWDFMDELLKLPLHEFVKRQDEFEAQVRAKSSPMTTVKLLVPALWRARVQYGRDELSWTVLDVEFAVARYRATHGWYPETLGELKPLMLTNATDPLSGKPLYYRLEQNGSFTIWSVGNNLIDDGGEVGERHNPWRGNDHVWNSRLLSGPE